MSAIVVRPLAPGDGPALRYGFAHLSARSRRRRFLGVRTELSDAEWERLLAVDQVAPRRGRTRGWPRGLRHDAGVAELVVGLRS